MKNSSEISIQDKVTATVAISITLAVLAVIFGLFSDNFETFRVR